MTASVEDVLAHFRIGADRLLGRGGQSQVFWLDDARVLRVPHGEIPHPAQLARTRTINTFLANARSADLPFALPLQLSHGELGGRPWTIEQRIPGRSLDQVLASLPAGPDRTTALQSYASAVAHLRDVPLPPGRGYGGFWDVQPTWADALVARVKSSVALGGPQLAVDVPNVAAVAARWGEDIRTLPVGPPAFVHGDYFPGNVMVGDDLQVTGVIDIGELSLFGDPRLDVAGALGFLSIRDHEPDDQRIVAEVLRPEPLPTRLYLRFYALLFCFTEVISPASYAWCVNILQEPWP